VPEPPAVGPLKTMSTIAHHYVPQFYLRHFAKKRRNKFYLWCLDKTTEKTFRSNPKNLAQETGFYDIRTINGEDITLEEYLSKLETKFGVALENLCKNPTTKGLTPNIDDMSLFVACQMIRTPILHKEINDASNELNRRLQKDHVQIPLSSPDELKQIQASMIVENAPIMAKVLSEMMWIILHNESKVPFFTSDNPVIKYNPLNDGVTGNLGLLSEGIQIYFPISPTHALIICDKRQYFTSKTEIKASSQNIEFVNSGQVLFSQRYIYSSNNNFDLAIDMLKKSPDLADPNRMRVIIK
jgi:hypothetical protein